MIVSSFRSLKNKYGKLRVLSQTFRDDFFSYLTDFSYFTLKIGFRKLLDTVRTDKN
jgi:hypothetical protein